MLNIPFVNKEVEIVEYVKVYCLSFQQGVPVLIKTFAQFLSQFYYWQDLQVKKSLQR